LTATVWVFVGMARIHHIRFPLVDFAKTVAVGLLAWFVTRTLAGDAHDLIRLTVAATAGGGVFLLACVPTRLIGAREWGLLTTSTRRLLTMRTSGATTPS
jgi:hypothetical protein